MVSGSVFSANGWRVGICGPRWDGLLECSDSAVTCGFLCVAAFDLYHTLLLPISASVTVV